MKWPGPLNLYEDASKRLSSYKYGHDRDRRPPVRSGSYDPVISVTVMPALIYGGSSATGTIAIQFAKLYVFPMEDT